ncbi:MAG TPA: hypothetical protein VF707_06095 [Ardenticatenaceae bacterium]
MSANEANPEQGDEAAEEAAPKPKRTRRKRKADKSPVVAAASVGDEEGAEVAPKPKRTRRPRKSKEEREGEEQRAGFSRGMELWLRSMKYQVGITGEEIEQGKEVELAGKAIEVAKALVGTAIPMVASSGGNSEELFYTLVSLLPLADLFGFQVKAGSPMLVPVIYADTLTPEELFQRFEQFFELAEPLAEFGLKLNGRPQGPALVYPLVVYFDAQKFAQDVPLLLPRSHLKKILHMAAVDAGYINVPERTVRWRKTDGLLMGLAKGISRMMGQKYPIFDERDLAAVLTLANAE